MPKLQDLGLTTEKVGEDLDYATIPDQMGSFAPPPQPGPFRFKLPLKMDDIWEPVEATNVRKPGKRISANFDDSHPLTIIQSRNGQYDGEPFTTRISNVERKRGKKEDQTAPEVSDMDYLLRDGLGEEAKPPTNIAYAQTLMKHAGGEFGADLEWSWSCRKDKPKRIDNGEGGYETLQENGCGTRYYQADVDKVPVDPNDPSKGSVFPERITCQCQASVRAFANLTRFRQ